MSDRSKEDWRPSSRDTGYLSWSIPSQCWSGEEYGEDTIKVSYEYATDEWHATTEMDQCTKRDLEPEEVVQLRAEFFLDRYLDDYRPRAPGR